MATHSAKDISTKISPHQISNMQRDAAEQIGELMEIAAAKF